MSTINAPVGDLRNGDHAGTERRTFTETKLGTKTSEFYLAIVAIAGVLITAYMDDGDALSSEDGWRYATFIAVAYIISRGLAKLGSREPYTERY